MAWLDKVTALTGGVKNLVIIGIIVYIALSFGGLKNNYTDYLKTKLAYEKTQAVERKELELLLKQMSEANKRLMTQIEESKVIREEIRMDVGKSIRDFNRKVKELKNVEDPEESYRHLSDAWTAD